MISFLITVCNELEEVQRLITQLKEYKNSDDEIVVLFDSKNGTKKVLDYLFTVVSEDTRVIQKPFEKDFAKFKNLGNSFCKKDWIFQVDADEYFTEVLLENLHMVLENNEGLDLIYIPRINLVEGITKQHVLAWGWRVNKSESVIGVKEFENDDPELVLIREAECVISEQPNLEKTTLVVDYYKPIINFPDYQSRLYRNKPSIKWEGKVHETVKGADTVSQLPPEFFYCLMHPKTIEKQEKQNELYSKI